MQFVKRFYQPITLLVIVVAAIFGLERGVTFENNPPGEAAVLLKKVDDVIAKLQHHGQPGEVTAPSQRISSTEQVVIAETGVYSAQQPGQAENTLLDMPGQANVPEHADEETAVAEGTESSSAAPPMSAGNMEEGDKVPPLASVNSITQDGSVTGQSGTAARNTHAEVTPERIRQVRRIWQQARLAAWKGEFATALEHYRVLVEQQPDNFDAYGEMGNVLLNSGDREGAAEAYYRAATLINNTSHRMMAWHLLNVLAWLAPKKADKLHQELLQRP